MTTVYCYSKCTTCKRALKWLDDNKIEYKLIEGASQIASSMATGTKVNLFGNDVLLYKFPYAGFLCEDK